MTENLLSDAPIQQAVSRVQLRSERQENMEQLLSTFVDPGINVQLQNENNQILYGRRGTGKTHVLKVLQLSGQTAPTQLPIYIDMRTLGSSSVFNDEGRPTHVRVTSLLRDLLAHVESAFLEWATNPQNEVPGPVFEALGDLSTAITRSVMSDVEVQAEEASASERRVAGEARVDVSLRPGIALGSKTDDVTSEGERIQRSGREIQPIYFQEVADALDKVLQAAGLQRLTILLDEWTAVPLDLQPLLAEFLKRSFFGNPRITVKIASIEYRSNFSEPLGNNNVLGFELGADISSLIELDDYYVYDRNPERTVEMFSELLFRHISAEAGTNGEPNYLIDKYGIQEASQFVRALFTSPEAFQELVRAGEGVARDFINIFTSAFFNSVRRQRNTVDIRAVQLAAREWYEKDKAPNVDENQARILRRLVDDVIGARRARSFLLEKQYEGNEFVRSLFDFRVIHLVQRGYADKDNPGLRYNIYTLDYGTYVDLLGTQKAPGDDFTEELTSSGEEVVVPFDDRRSIRRIILRPENLQPS